MQRIVCMFVFFFQAEDGIRDKLVTGVQTCALPIFRPPCKISICNGAWRKSEPARPAFPRADSTCVETEEITVTEKLPFTARRQRRRRQYLTRHRRTGGACSS